MNLLLVGANDEWVRKAKDLGLTVLLLQHPSKLTPLQEELADVVHVLDYTEWAEVEPVARRLRAEPGYEVALSLTEPGLDNAGRINDLFRLGGTGFEVTKRFRDKLTMRKHLAAIDPNAVGAQTLEQREQLDAFGARYGYPFIVKPNDATASIGVHQVNSPADADAIWAAVERLRGTRTDRISTLMLLQDFLMEEFVEGPEFSVETFSFSGRHVVVAITEKFTDDAHFAELGHAVPARLDVETQDEVSAAVGSFLDLMGLRDGVSHTEIRIGARGPQVIESHNRGAGDAITDLVQGAYGIDLISYALGWPFGLVPELPGRPVPKAGASTRFIVGVPGKVESIDGADEARAQKGVLDVRISAKVGDTVRTLRDNWDRLGLVAVVGADTTDAIRRGAELIGETIRIKVAGDDGETRFAHVAEVA
ncbi:ATP-grasp domain-containing protein [Amycolatopsis sp. NPDC059657]|uniref:ATP-grasp domain-containing protein n=1 Tax=Amycolatopsis sp. NPDC059657 TaxID=3346899 RepID=UPI0036707F1B